MHIMPKIFTSIFLLSKGGGHLLNAYYLPGISPSTGDTVPNKQNQNASLSLGGWHSGGAADRETQASQWWHRGGGGGSQRSLKQGLWYQCEESEELLMQICLRGWGVDFRQDEWQAQRSWGRVSQVEWAKARTGARSSGTCRTWCEGGGHQKLLGLARVSVLSEICLSASFELTSSTLFLPLSASNLLKTIYLVLLVAFYSSRISAFCISIFSSSLLKPSISSFNS